MPKETVGGPEIKAALTAAEEGLDQLLHCPWRLAPRALYEPAEDPAGTEEAPRIEVLEPGLEGARSES